LPYPIVLIVSGSRNSGKTALCIKIFKHFSKKRANIGGVITLKGERNRSKGDERFAQNLVSGKRALLAVRKPDERYRFIPAGVRFANRAIGGFSGNILIVDEIGKLEKKGRGFKEVFKKLNTRPPHAVVISCRDENVKWLTDKIARKVFKIDTQDARSKEIALKLIARAISQK